MKNSEDQAHGIKRENEEEVVVEENKSTTELSPVYSALLKESKNSQIKEKLHKYFTRLNDAGIYDEEVAKKVSECIKLSHYTSMLGKIVSFFIRLKKENIFFGENESFRNLGGIDNIDIFHIGCLEKYFDHIFQCDQKYIIELLTIEKRAFQLYDGFRVLKEASIYLAENASIYKDLIVAEHKKYIPSVRARVICNMQRENIDYLKNKFIYEIALEYDSLSCEFIQCVSILNKMNISIKSNNGKFFRLMLSCKKDISVQLNLFEQFEKSGLKHIRFFELSFFVEYPEYKKLTEALCNISQLTPVFPFCEIDELYHAVLTSNRVLKNIEGIENVSQTLYAWGISYKTHPWAFNKNILIDNSVFFDNPLDFLLLKDLVLYPAAVHFLVKKLSEKKISLSILAKVKLKLNNFLKQTSHISGDVLHENQEKLLKMLEENFEAADHFSVGPLNKNPETVLIEEILALIANTDVDKVIIRFESDSEFYFLSIPGKKEINLSLVIRNSNLSQLTLSCELVEQLVAKAQSLSMNKFRERINEITKLLIPSQQIAINVYASEYYKNINKLFFSEPLDYNWSHQFCIDQKKEPLACFIWGCVFNDAINCLNTLVDNTPEKVLLNKFFYEHGMSPFFENVAKLLEKNKAMLKEERELLKNVTETKFKAYYPSFDLLCRGEKLTDEIIERRLANPWRAPAITSFSTYMDGAPGFRANNMKKTKLEHATVPYIINFAEKEIVVPQGNLFVTSTMGDFFCSTIVNSPELETNCYRSDLALWYAFKTHLSKPYAQKRDHICLNGKIIERPNHNITHTSGVMSYLPLVINYFAAFSHDKNFRLYCQMLSYDELEWLRNGAAFSVTGRESEIAAVENLKLYDLYRENSAKHFNDFIEEHGFQDKIMQPRLHHVVRYMGNPAYESDLNKHPQKEEREIRNYLYRILTVAHKLDLARCYSVEQYTTSLKLCRELSVSNDEQRLALTELIRYAIEHIKARGDALRTDIDAQGKLYNVHRDYDSKIYPEASLSMKRLIELTEKVSKPKPWPFERVYQDKPKPKPL